MTYTFPAVQVVGVEIVSPIPFGVTLITGQPVGKGSGTGSGIVLSFLQEEDNNIPVQRISSDFFTIVEFFS